ncbi:MAG: pyrroloquinoline quinone biosynthesis protein PqqB [bacterium]|nr:pyrroloquinoline quinone biosynthesis protein PqqB [bacterium]
MVPLIWLGRATAAEEAPREQQPYVLVLGIAQDGGYPQAGTKESPAWDDPSLRRLASCLAVVDPETSQRWLLDATPDFREQLHRLDQIAPVPERPGLAGIVLTHGHIGHYTGLMHLGREVMGTRQVPVYAMPRMAELLRTSGPWSQLVRLNNISLHPLRDREPVRLNARLSVTPFLVPHRGEYTETVGLRVDGPRRSVLFIPDIDKWERWDEQGQRVEEAIAPVDVAFLDGTFFADGEIPGRDLSEIPHPVITKTMKRFARLPAAEKQKVRFIHLNCTNPALDPRSEAHRAIEEAGFGVARALEKVPL